MLALVLAPLLVASQAFADADTDADPTQTTPTGTTAESGATDDEDKGGCGGCALANPTSLLSLGAGAALLLVVRRRR